MHPSRFKQLLDELDGNSLQTLKEKNAKYAQNGDCLHNFRSGAEITGKSPAETCWGYMSKHLVALRDKVEKNNFSDREDFLEKCQDTINYIRFLWCIGNETSFPDEDKADDSINEAWCRWAFPTQREADIFQNLMKDRLFEYGSVTVSYAYEILDMDSDRYQSYQYGWVNLADMKCSHDEECSIYTVELPTPIKIN